MGQVIHMNEGPELGGDRLRRLAAVADRPVGRVPAPKVRAAILEALPGDVAGIARALCRPPSDKTVRRRLADLETEGLIVRKGDAYELAPEDQRPDPELPEWLDGYQFPAHFDHDSKELLVVKLDEHEIGSSTELELLESYVGALQLARTANAALDEAGMFSTARTGRTYVHPGVAVAQQAERDAAKYREALDKLDEKKAGGDDDDQQQLFDA